MPWFQWSQYWPVNGRSVAASRVTRYSMSDSWERHSASVLVVVMIVLPGSAAFLGAFGLDYDEQLTSRPEAQSGGSFAYDSASGCSSNGFDKTAIRRSTSEKSLSRAARIAVSAI